MPRRAGALARLRDAAVLLPFVGLVLLMPPFIGLFPPAVRVAGIPLLALYVFAVWVVLIALAAVLARKLPSDGEPEPLDGGQPPARPR